MGMGLASGGAKRGGVANEKFGPEGPARVGPRCVRGDGDGHGLAHEHASVAGGSGAAGGVEALEGDGECATLPPDIEMDGGALRANGEALDGVEGEPLQRHTVDGLHHVPHLGRTTVVSNGAQC